MHESFMHQGVAYHTARFGVAPPLTSNWNLLITHLTLYTYYSKHFKYIWCAQFHTKYYKLHCHCILHAESFIQKELFNTVGSFFWLSTMFCQFDSIYCGHAVCRLCEVCSLPLCTMTKLHYSQYLLCFHCVFGVLVVCSMWIAHNMP